jgi:tryptophan synthase
MKVAKTLSKDKDLVVVSPISFFHFVFIFIYTLSQCLSGRGDKDVEQISDLLPKWADILDWHVSPHAQSGVKKT